MLGIEKLLGIINQSLEGPRTPAGFRPKGWEIPPKRPGDSDILLTKGEADGSHVTIRVRHDQSNYTNRK